MKFVAASAALVSAVYAQDTQVNSTAGNATISSHASIQAGYERCDAPRDAVVGWYYTSKSSGPYNRPCADVDSSDKWVMLNAYRAGGKEGVHWKYTNDPNDGECMNNWKHYSDNGQNLIATVSGRTSFQGSSRRWCALPVYRQGGVLGKQWAYCTCTWNEPPRWE